MPICIYCRLDKPETDFSLEHIIPQSLGGAAAPDYLKTRRVCKICNNNLGSFVDASFEKDWFVSHQLNLNARLLFDPNNPSPLPLICIGPCNLAIPGITAEEICESWLGPFGEQIYWIRPKDEKLFWYIGGNPRTTKTIESRAYFLLSKNSTKDLGLVWISFKNAFPGKKVKKIMCTSIVGAAPPLIGFSTPDKVDEVRINFLRDRPVDSPNINGSLSFYTQYDLRFLAKLATGLAFALFGESTTQTLYSAKLHKALWHKPGDDLPQLEGQRTLGNEQDLQFTKIVSVKGGICFIITKAGADIAMNLCLNSRFNWSLKIAESPPTLDSFNDFALVLFPSISKSVQLPLIDFIAHQIGENPHPELSEVNSKISNSENYFNNLIT